MTRYRVIGQVGAYVEGRTVTLTRTRERHLLAVLVAAGGRAVSVERLLGELWGPDAPASALGVLQVSVSRLRALLDPDRAAGPVLVRTPGGYRLEADESDVDVWMFEAVAARALVADGAGERLRLTAEAGALWSAGEPYADCPAPSVRAEAARLTDLFVAVSQVRAGTLLALGRADDAVRLLAPLAADNPYREELWALLARAQFASARQADALATLATLRSRLVEDLGVDPAPCVREMERRILTQDEGLLPAPPQPRHVRPGTGRTRHCRALRPAALPGR